MKEFSYLRSQLNQTNSTNSEIQTRVHSGHHCYYANDELIKSRTLNSSSNLKIYKSLIRPILFNLYSECLTKEALDGLGDFNIGGQIIQTMKYADNLVLMTREETMLQGMIDKLIEVAMAWK